MHSCHTRTANLFIYVANCARADAEFHMGDEPYQYDHRRWPLYLSLPVQLKRVFLLRAPWVYLEQHS